MLKDSSIHVTSNSPNIKKPYQIKSRASVFWETTQQTKLNDVIVDMSRLNCLANYKFRTKFGWRTFLLIKELLEAGYIIDVTNDVDF